MARRVILSWHPPAGHLMPRRAVFADEGWRRLSASTARAEIASRMLPEARRARTRLGEYYYQIEGLEPLPVSAAGLAALYWNPRLARRAAAAIDCRARVGRRIVLDCPGGRVVVHPPGRAAEYPRPREGLAPVPAVPPDAAVVAGFDILASRGEDYQRLAELAARAAEYAASRSPLRVGRLPAWTVKRAVLRVPAEALLPAPVEAERSLATPLHPEEWERSGEAALSGEAAPARVTVQRGLVGVGVPGMGSIHVDPWLLARLAGGDEIVDVEELLALLESRPEAALERLLLPLGEPWRVQLRGPGLHLVAARARPSTRYLVHPAAHPYVSVPADHLAATVTRQGLDLLRRVEKKIAELAEAG